MAVAMMKAVFQCNVQKVWNVVTSLENYSWRSDLSKIEVVNEKQFIEYTKDGFATEFTITAVVPNKLWKFNIENDNIKGHWTGVFSQGNGTTEIIFTEAVTSKKILMKPFVKAFLKKQQKVYVKDLRKALGE